MCGVFFDQDEVSFEVNYDRIFIIAELGSAIGREDAFNRLLSANYLGAQTGFAFIGIDSTRQTFTLNRILDGDLTYKEFEDSVTLFIKALRYWKEWLSLPQEIAQDKPVEQFNTVDQLDVMIMLRV